MISQSWGNMGRMGLAWGIYTSWNLFKYNSLYGYRLFKYVSNNYWRIYIWLHFSLVRNTGIIIGLLSTVSLLILVLSRLGFFLILVLSRQGYPSGSYPELVECTRLLQMELRWQIGNPMVPAKMEHRSAQTWICFRSHQKFVEEFTSAMRSTMKAVSKFQIA